jgi:hypothetical protein
MTNKDKAVIGLKTHLQTLHGELQNNNSANIKFSNRYSLYYQLIHAGNMAKNILENYPDDDPPMAIGVLNDLVTIRGKVSHYTYVISKDESDKFLSAMQTYLIKYSTLPNIPYDEADIESANNIFYPAQQKVKGHLSSPNLSEMDVKEYLNSLVKRLKTIEERKLTEANLDIFAMIWIEIGNILNDMNFNKLGATAEEIKQLKNCSRGFIKNRDKLSHEYEMLFNKTTLMKMLNQSRDAAKNYKLRERYEVILQKLQPSELAESTVSSSYKDISSTLDANALPMKNNNLLYTKMNIAKANESNAIKRPLSPRAQATTDKMQPLVKRSRKNTLPRIPVPQENLVENEANSGYQQS